VGRPVQPLIPVAEETIKTKRLQNTRAAQEVGGGSRHIIEGAIDAERRERDMWQVRALTLEELLPEPKGLDISLSESFSTRMASMTGTIENNGVLGDRAYKSAAGLPQLANRSRSAGIRRCGRFCCRAYTSPQIERGVVRLLDAFDWSMYQPSIIIFSLFYHEVSKLWHV
jgi:hypothetical protein